MKIILFCFSFLLLVFCLKIFGTESYSELMDQAEKLTSQHYGRTSRAFKIKSDELDAILDSQIPQEEKIKQLKEFIQNLEKLRKKTPGNDRSPKQEIPGNSFLKIKQDAEKGDPEALYRLGRIYWEGKQLPRSLTRALRCFRKSAAKNHLPSRFMLALADLNGKGVIPDPKKALTQFRKLYEEGFIPAGVPLGIQYYEGRGTEKNYALAAECLHRGKTAKTEIPMDFSPEAILGKIYCRGGFGLQADPVQAIRYLKEAQDDPEAQFLLAGLYRDGRGTPKNASAAAEAFRRAAEKGHIPAGFEIGRMYRLGLGVKKDDALAVRYLAPAAEHDFQHDAAAMMLGEIYADPASPVKNDQTAFHYFRAAARKGNVNALYRCGNMLMNGAGTTPDQRSALEYLSAAAGRGHSESAFLCGEIEAGAGHPEKSVSYYRQAADSGHASAIRKFSTMAINGQGMKADPELGIQYLKKLEDMADISDLEQLGALYESGIGPVRADLPEAIRYYSAAARKGSISSQIRLALIHHSLGQEKLAMQYAQAAAEAKNPDAVLLLAELRKNASPATEKPDETLRDLQELADRGNRNARRKLGLLLYRNGKLLEAEKYLKDFETDQQPEILYVLGDIACRRSDGKADYSRAFHLLKRSSEAGQLKALIQLGRLYHRGEGVRQDFRRALICYRQAAEKQDPEGMFLTGLMYYNGEGVSPDFSEAYRWFRQAAEKENMLAMQYLSIMYKEGIGVPKNNIEAARWRRKAAGSKK